MPTNDPLLLVPAMAAVTRRLGFAVTASTTFEGPYPNARRFATLDHLTRGRIGWNVVTTSSPVVSDLHGTAPLPAHDVRYDVADEHLELSYRLLEGAGRTTPSSATSGPGATPTRAASTRCTTTALVLQPRLLQGRALPAAHPRPVPGRGQRPGPGVRRHPRGGGLRPGPRRGGGAPAGRGRPRAGRAPRPAPGVRAHPGRAHGRAGTRPRARPGPARAVPVVGPRRRRAGVLRVDDGRGPARTGPARRPRDVSTEGGRTQVERYRGQTVARATADFLRFGMRSSS